MSFVDELERLERLRQSGALSDDEFEQAKTKLLDGAVSSSADAKQLTLLQKEVELTRLDRAWEYEKQTYTIQVRGNRYVPSASEGIFTALIASCVGGGLIWMWSALGADGLGSRTPNLWILPFVGIFFIAGGSWSGVQIHNKATRYAARKHVYFEEREEIIRRR